MEEKRKRRKWPLVAGVVAVVLVAAGIGFFAWHEQPSFCNAICHEPMDPYVEGYFGQAVAAEPGQAAAAESAEPAAPAAGRALMVQAHQQEGTTCLQCHEAKIDEQVIEGLNWISGNYRVGDDGMLATAGVTADQKMCAKSGCHEWADVVAATQDWGGEAGVNPHKSHQGEAIDCSNCHSAHGTSNLFCNTCHDYRLPDGWQSPK